MSKVEQDNVSTSQRPVTRPNTGSRLRLPARGTRRRYLEADVTLGEYKQIIEHCLTNKVSVSQFLAELILEDAAKLTAGKRAVRIDDLELQADEYDKLELLAHVYKKNSVGEMIRELLKPHLDLQRLHVPTERGRSLRFYLDHREHETVTTYIASRGITARRYVSFLAIRTIAKLGKRRKGV